MDYHSRAKSLDERGGDTRDGFEAELNSYGQGGRVKGLRRETPAQNTRLRRLTPPRGLIRGPTHITQTDVWVSRGGTFSFFKRRGYLIHVEVIGEGERFKSRVSEW